jgi:hypothetical protein
MHIEVKFIDGTVWEGMDTGSGKKKPYGTVTLLR